ncbi:HNH endonuclease signature motif containing protein, partial [Microbacterium sp.]|uniref:HNH endonuclease signature motif containing protein n=1 Tax=Microbacterium sp. TaxID=51671 RepID=UPI0027349963
SDRAGKRRRHFTIGKLRDGSVPVRGELLPEVAAQLQKLIDSLLKPKAEDTGSSSTVRFRPSDDTGDGERTSEYGAEEVSDRADGLEPHKAKAPPVEAADLRTHAQKRHDAFATVLMVAAASGGMPTLGEAAPTLVVSVTAEDFASRTGRARVEGAGHDVPLGAADHAGCAGGVQRVLFDPKGAIVAIGTTARLFNATQRRAIVLRDRECLIPGCGVPAEWCEIHHVTEHARGGPTHTSNGVPLCWHHHRTLDEGIWKIRIRDGLPEIRGPGWWDPYAKWRSPHHDYRAVDHALDRERERERAREPAWNTW